MEKLIDDIKKETILTHYTTGIKEIDHSVLNAIKSVDRAFFVSKEESNLAYIDSALPIGFGQTISQPFIVALMIHALSLEPQHKVLEVGSGSGYALAILSKLAALVIGLEFVPQLCQISRENLKKAHIENVLVVEGDGTKGLPAKAPFDRILVSAAAKEIPRALFLELKVGGIMVIPKSITPYEQILLKITKKSSDEMAIEELIPVRFVPLVNS